MDIKRLPEHMKREYVTLHDFRATKRSHAQLVDYALRDLRIGSAYTPAYKEILEAISLIETIRKKLSVKQWGP